ncbi:SAC3/GANP family domain-containing protein [Ditylenchus destructor]|uniref:SAC3/GANP family domain-containing protein n=1 Tax=Ditylenchus destructor TaxID=166010 RepID=A0AAD4NFM5_9BILA|nr:SAC3/GANP family domain-containing protein [Ditylenchus destructor]
MSNSGGFNIPNSLRRLPTANSNIPSTSAPSTSLQCKVVPINEICSQGLQSLIGTRCETSADKYMLLKKRDELMCKARVKNTDVSVMDIVQGTCPDMCPEKERYMRESQKNLNRYECDSNGAIIPKIAVKDYSRSAADQEEPLPHELRPTEVLEMTTNYLLNNIASEMPSSSSELGRWYDFLWSRTRSIRKDITQQMLKDRRAVDLVEKCTRLHVFAAYKLAKLEFSDFNQKMNTENLSKSLQTLRHMYDDLASEGQFCGNEAEFRSYDVILNLSDSNVHSQVLSYRDEVRESELFRVAMELATAYQNTNYVQFFRLLKHRATYLQACISHRYFSPVRHSALRIICSAYPLYSLEKLVEILGFDSEGEAQSFLDSIGIEMDQADENYISARGWREAFSRMGAIDTLPVGTCRWIQNKVGNTTLPEILCNGPCAPVRLPSPVDSFDENGRYVCDPFNIYSTSVSQSRTNKASSQTKMADRSFFPIINEELKEKTPIQKKPIENTGFLPKTTTTNAPKEFGHALGFGEFSRVPPSKSIFSVTPSFTFIPTRTICENNQEKKSPPIEKDVSIALKEIPSLPPPATTYAEVLCLEPLLSSSSPTEVPEQEQNSPAAVEEAVTSESLITLPLKAETSRFILSETEDILHWVTTRETEFVAYAVFEEVQRLNSALEKFQDNMFNLWLHQFTDRWKDFVQKKKLVRSFIIHPQCGHASMYNNQNSRHDTPPTKRRRITAEQVELRFYARQFKTLRTEWLEKRYFAKWRRFVEYHKKKRYLDSALDHYCFLRTSYR